jgi:hypothetical protein
LVDQEVERNSSALRPAGLEGVRERHDAAEKRDRECRQDDDLEHDLSAH